MEFNLEVINPNKVTLAAMAEKYRGLIINGVEDKDGYKAADDARKDLQKARVTITKALKEKRDDAIKYQRDVLAYEKDLLGIITPVEDDLKSKIGAVDDEMLREKRRELLPDRIAKLASVGCAVPDDEILALDEAKFYAFFFERKAGFDAAKLKEIEDKNAVENRAKREKEIAETAAAGALAEEKLKRDQAAANKKLADEREAKNLARRKTYQAFLDKNGVDFNPALLGTVGTFDKFVVLKDATERVALYALVDTLN